LPEEFLMTWEPMMARRVFWAGLPYPSSINGEDGRECDGKADV
jgi:hypothetical protein